MGVFCYVPRDLSIIIAIGHHSRKLGRQVSLSVCYAIFSNFANGYRPEFWTNKAANLHQQSPRSNLKSCRKLGVCNPLRGFFAPLKTTPLSGALDQNVRRNFAKISKSLYGRGEAVGDIDRIGRASLGPALSRLADCDFCCITQTTVANKKLSRR